MTNIHSIYIDTDPSDTTAMNSYFAQHDADWYEGTLEEAHEEMRGWLNQGIATTEATDENTEEITIETMQALIQEHVLHAA